jgi:type IV pilus assembly protein PilC
MSVFNYKAKNKKGRVKRGSIVSIDKNRAVDSLVQQGLRPSSVKDVSNTSMIKINNFLNPVKKKDLVIFSRQFAVMIKAGVSITEALIAIIEQTENIKFKNIISEIAYDVNSGENLSTSLRKFSKIFSEFYCSVVEAGEVSGGLDDSLEYLADETEKDYNLLKKFKGALIYPAFVLSGLVIVGVIFLLFVLPELIKILKETGADLPLATRVVIITIDFFQKYYLFIIGLIIAIIIFLKIFSKNELGRRKLDSFLLKLPVIGKIFQLVYLVRFSRSFSTLLRGGVSINRSLGIASDIVKNTVYKDIINRTADNVKEGGSVSEILNQSNFVPKMLPEMMSVGEKAGKLDETLREVAKFYEKEINYKLNNLNTIIEPVIMVIMGIAVGIMVAAIILPMYNIAGQI